MYSALKSDSYLRNNQQGFTLVELMISLSIIIILSAFAVPSFSRYLDTQNIRQAQEQIKNDLRTLQNRALSGYQYTEGDNYWAAKFSESEYLFQKTTDADGAACDGISDVSAEKSYSLPSSVIILNTDVCFFFEFSSGDLTVINGNKIYLDRTGSTAIDCLFVEGVVATGLIRTTNSNGDQYESCRP